MMLRNEDDLKALFVKTISPDFEILSEVWGNNLVENKRIRADFVMRAKSHLFEYGITHDWIGIEVKFIDADKGKVGSQINKVYWQAVTYSQTVFKIGKPPFAEETRPGFVLVLTNTRSIPEKHQARLSSVLSFCQYANVGQLVLSPVGYNFKFGGGGYFSKYKEAYKKGLTNVGTRRYAGNANNKSKG